MLRHFRAPKGQARDKAEKMAGRAVMKGYRVSPVGSRAVLAGSNPKSDWDFLIDGYGMDWELTKNGFERDTGSEVPDERFKSVSFTYAGQRINFIQAKTPEFYDEFLASQMICTEQRVRKKEDRVHIFETIRRGDPLDMDKLPSNPVRVRNSG